MPKVLKIPRHSGESWEEICEKVNRTQKEYSDSTEGFWHRIWYKIGDSKELVSPWADLIPDAYGLAVVKVGVAVIIKIGL